MPDPIYGWRIERILRFMERQQRARQWIPCAELAERYGRERDAAEGLDRIADWIASGRLETAGRCRALYLHPASARVKLTRDALKSVAQFGPAVVREAYIARCWMPRASALAWCAENQVPTRGWLDGAIPQQDANRKGRRAYDDGPALALMSSKVNAGASIRSAAREAVAELALTVPVHGASVESIAGRLREKFKAL